MPDASWQRLLRKNLARSNSERALSFPDQVDPEIYRTSDFQKSRFASSSRLLFTISVSAFSIGGKRLLLEFVLLETSPFMTGLWGCIVAHAYGATSIAVLIMLFPFHSTGRGLPGLCDQYAPSQLNTQRIHCSHYVNVVAKS